MPVLEDLWQLRCRVAIALTCTKGKGEDVHMARTVVTHITDDLDGSKDAEEVRFALQGVEYTIDLSKKNRAALEKALKPYVDVATKVSTRSAARSSTRRSGGQSNGQREVREWAKAQGIEISDRGRIPGSVVEQYENRAR